MIEIICPICKSKALKSKGHFNRAKKIGAQLYCSRECSHESRRAHIPLEVKKEEKRLYDMEYRLKNRDKLKKQKAEWFQKHYKENPEYWKSLRKRRMAYHVEYCRQPEYKAKKHKYDRRRYAKEKYGELWESHVAIMEIVEEVRKTTSKYESMKNRGVLNKTIQRSRNEKVKRGYT